MVCNISLPLSEWTQWLPAALLCLDFPPLSSSCMSFLLTWQIYPNQLVFNSSRVVAFGPVGHIVCSTQVFLVCGPYLLIGIAQR